MISGQYKWNRNVTKCVFQYSHDSRSVYIASLLTSLVGTVKSTRSLKSGRQTVRNSRRFRLLHGLYIASLFRSSL